MLKTLCNCIKEIFKTFSSECVKLVMCLSILLLVIMVIRSDVLIIMCYFLPAVLLMPITWLLFGRVEETRLVFVVLWIVVLYQWVVLLMWCVMVFLPKLIGISPIGGRNLFFFLMSRRPAIGSSYLTAKSKKWHISNDSWYFPDGKFKKPLPRYFRNKIFDKFRCAAHTEQYILDAEKRLHVSLKQFSNESNPLSAYYQALSSSSDLYLANLRNQKKLKNKLL